MTNAIVSVITSKAKPRKPLGEKLLTILINKFQVASNPRLKRLLRLSPKVNFVPNTSKFNISIIA